jgi:hypothetical protein
MVRAFYCVKRVNQQKIKHGVMILVGYGEDLMSEQSTDLTLVAETLDIANEHGMAAEVMWSALVMAAEANEHGQTMEQVLEAALGEWDI